MKKILFIPIVLLIVLFSCQQKEIKIACVGDSITEGYGVKNQSKSSYPVLLNNLVGKDTTVLNCGRSAATMMKDGDLPYWKCMEFYDVFAYKPDIIIIKLGTNDSKDNLWNAKKYEEDYQAMVDTFKTIPSHPKIYLCLPIPAFEHRWLINDTTINEQIIPIIKNIAEKNKLHVIDLNSGYKDKGKFCKDGIHPNEQGNEIMAEMVHDQL